MLDELAVEIREVNHANGWNILQAEEWADRYKVPGILALVHSEVSEALEEWRKEHRLEHFAGELADIIIRVAQLGVGLGIDLDQAVIDKQQKNREREFKHGGRRI